MTNQPQSPARAGATDIFDRRESEVRSYCRSFDTVFTRAQGSTLWDAEGREYRR